MERRKHSDVTGMEQRRGAAFCLSFLNNVLRGSQFRAGRGEMSPWGLAGVFLCGVVCAGVVAVLQAWWAGVRARPQVLTASLGVLPAGADLTLMDEGYVAMALLGDHEDHQLTTTTTATAASQTTELQDHRKGMTSDLI